MGKIVQKVLFQCLGYQQEERVLIVTDDELFKTAQIFYKEIKKSGIEVSLISFPPRSRHGEEPPPEVGSALSATDIAFLITSRSLSHTQARQQASQKYGVRIASLPGITMEVLRRSLDVDYVRLKKETQKIVERWRGKEKILVKTERGSELIFSIKGRVPFADNGVYIKKGAFGNLPAGEVCIAPREGTAEGLLIIDASFAGMCRLKRPIELSIKNGYVTKISDGRLQKILANLGKSALNIAEFGIGLNPKAQVTGNVLEDEKAIGTAHIALGNNLSFGGKVNAKCHLDGVFFKPLVWVDGKRLI
ncbi:MAG: aminopeptidase [Candidatus Omnitrophica bacterium]|nr:aminopeptidase [Candidatus Omnitrophota bacterium]